MTDQRQTNTDQRQTNGFYSRWTVSLFSIYADFWHIQTNRPTDFYKKKKNQKNSNI